MRARAIQAGSTAHLHEGGGIWTTETGTAKPSFLKNKRKAGETPGEDDQSKA
jgi:hypothetical protein